MGNRKSTLLAEVDAEIAQLSEEMCERFSILHETRAKLLASPDDDARSPEESGSGSARGALGDTDWTDRGRPDGDRDDHTL